MSPGEPLHIRSFSWGNMELDSSDIPSASSSQVSKRLETLESLGAVCAMGPTKPEIANEGSAPYFAKLV